jgi:hypothetical protein
MQLQTYIDPDATVSTELINSRMVGSPHTPSCLPDIGHSCGQRFPDLLHPGHLAFQYSRAPQKTCGMQRMWPSIVLAKE